MAYRFVVLFATIGAATASGYAGAGLLAAGPALGLGYGAAGLGYAGNLGYAAGPALLAAPGPAIGYAGRLGLGLTAGGAIGYAGPAVALAAPLAVPAAIQSVHNVQTYDVPISGNVQPVTVDVPANVLPMNFIFRSASSTINVASKHEGAKGSFKETVSQDEPHILKHTVTKPIIQEVYEIVSPYRKIQQTIEPVREEVQTLVAKGVGQLAAPVAAIAPTELRVNAGPALALAAPRMAFAAPAPLALAADCGLGGLGCAQAGYGLTLNAGIPATYKTNAFMGGAAYAGVGPLAYAGKKAW